LQCVAVCCSVLQCVGVCYNVQQCAAVCSSVLQCVAACCSVMQCIAIYCSLLQGLVVSRSCYFVIPRYYILVIRAFVTLEVHQDNCEVDCRMTGCEVTIECKGSCL